MDCYGVMFSIRCTLINSSGHLFPDCPTSLRCDKKPPSKDPVGHPCNARKNQQAVCFPREGLLYFIHFFPGFSQKNERVGEERESER